MKSQILFVSFFIIIVCASCKDNNKTLSDYPILKVSLVEKNISIYDIFHKVEIIPLQTIEESSFSYPIETSIHHDTIFILDPTLNSLFIFAPDGKYINKIHRVGQGPGEYRMVYDFLINHNENVIEMLNPMGFIIKYGLDGRFIRQDELPKPPMNYSNFKLLDENHYITWSLLDGDNCGVNVITLNDLRISSSYFPNSGLWGAFIGKVFYKYKNLVYYHESMNNKVYNITSDGYTIAYEWDLGTKIVDPKKLVVPIEKKTETLMKLGEDFKEGDIPFIFDNQYQTDKYYYATLRFGMANRKNLFYDKLTGVSMFFGMTIEGVSVSPILMNDEYMIGVLEYNHKEALRNIVSPEDAKLLDMMQEDDNKWLVKFLFK